MKRPGTSLVLESLQKAYDDFALDVSFRVDPGTLVSLLGPSGSGKTTSLRLIAGFETPDTGTIKLEGDDITHEPARSRRFGLVPQDLVLFPHLDVWGNVAYGLKAHGVGKQHIARRVKEMLALVGLEKMGRRRVGTLSGGEGQRVALARALAIEPIVLLLDEPFSALDAPLRAEMRREVVRIKDTLGISVIFVTHNQDEALSISDRIVLMHDGAVVQSGTPEEVFFRPANRFAAEFIGTANVLTAACVDDRHLQVTIGGVQIPIRADSEVEEGDTRLVLLRPHYLEFGESSRAFAAQVVERRFVGDRYEYICTAGGERLYISSPQAKDPGESVRLHFNPANSYLLPR